MAEAAAPKMAEEELLRMTADVVAAYVRNNTLPTTQLAEDTTKDTSTSSTSRPKPAGPSPKHTTTKNPVGAVVAGVTHEVEGPGAQEDNPEDHNEDRHEDHHESRHRQPHRERSVEQGEG